METLAPHHRLARSWPTTAITYKKTWERELDRRARHGITDLPPPFPHLDHVVIDMAAWTARIVGQWTRADHDLLVAQRADSEAEIAELERGFPLMPTLYGTPRWRN